MKQEIENFKFPEEEVWVAVLDGKIVKSHNKLACETKRQISTSFNHSLKEFSLFKNYGFESSSEMKNFLMSSGRLEFKKISL